MSHSSQRWRILDSGPCDFAYNMALDETLMEGAPAIGLPVLRFYGWRQNAASFGYFQRIAEIEAVTTLRPLVRRPTGGGLVPHENDWTYSVAIPPALPWYELRAAQSYEQMHRWIQSSFAALGIQSELASSCRKEVAGQCFAGYERSDVLRYGRKMAGAAQRRTKKGLLIQGSVQPPPPGLSRTEWHRAMIATLPGDSERWELPEPLHEESQALAERKYSRDDYNRRR